jgi:quercetin dioxygenase-like cupin family protein
MRRRNSIMLTVGAVALLAVAIGSDLTLTAQESPAAFAGSKVTPLIKADLNGISNRQVIANIYEVPAGKMVPLHFHHGDEFHLVLSGEWAAEVEGKPDHVMKPGDSQYVEREHWHGGQAIGADPLKLLGVMIVEKDKPMTEMKR